MSWLLVRGLGREARHWGRFADLLAETTGERVLCLDIAGAGQRFNARVPKTIDGLMEELRKRFLIEVNDNTEGWKLLTISLGGMIGMSWVSRYPKEFSHFVMINSSARGLSPVHHRLRLGVLPKLVGTVMNKSSLEREKRVLEMTSNVFDTDAQIAARHADYANEYPVKRKTILTQLLAATKFKVPDKIEIPTLVLNSLGDRFTSPKCSEQIARHFGAQIVSHDSAGHDLPLDAPDWVAEQVKTFVSA